MATTAWSWRATGGLEWTLVTPSLATGRCLMIAVVAVVVVVAFGGGDVGSGDYRLMIIEGYRKLLLVNGEGELDRGTVYRLQVYA